MNAPRRRGLLLTVLLASCASEPTGAGAERASEGRSTRLALESQAGAAGGFVRVREGPVNGPGEGTHLPLRSLGVHHVEAVAAEARIPLGAEPELRIRLRDVFFEGRSVLSQDTLFNGVSYDAGTALRVRPVLFDGLIDLRTPVVDLGAGAHIDALTGISFHYLDFKTWGQISPRSTGTDKNEDFYKQALPLPSLGVAAVVPLSDRVVLEAEAFGFRAIGWNSQRPEGGTVYLTEDDLEASLALVARISSGCELGVGLRYDYLHINEYSLEDGNEFQLRDPGLFVALRVRL